MLRELKAVARSRWVERAPHRLWLLGRADALFSFFEASCRNPQGGYFELDEAGRPMAPGADGGLIPSRNLHITTRLVHAFGRPRANCNQIGRIASTRREGNAPDRRCSNCFLF